MRHAFVAAAIGLALPVCMFSRSEARDLTFEDRVKAQVAIERINYAHQIGATRPFEAAVPRVVIEEKVRRYLEQSAALGTFWKTPIANESLQRELERMAGGTRMPERLQEIFAALGNDAFLIKECVARATLAERLTQNFYAFDSRYHAASRASADALRGKLVSGTLSPNAEHPNRTVSTRAVETEGGTSSPSSMDGRTSQDMTDERRPRRAPVGQASPVVESRDAFSFEVVLSHGATSEQVATYVVPKADWTGWWSTARKALRARSVRAVASDGGPIPAPKNGTAFDPNMACNVDGWNNGSLDAAPTARGSHTAVWTGSVMVIWGGTDWYSSFSHLDTGGRYDPVTDTWQSMTTVNAPRGRSGSTAVWTGTEMIVWGGYSELGNNYFVSGARYDPIADRWTRVALGPSARRGHTAVWTGSRMIVWGGYFGSYDDWRSLNTGSLYDPSTDTWTPMTTVGAPYGRAAHSAVWTGSQMIVFGGGGYDMGGRYNPSTDSWSSISDLVDWRAYHSAFWTGNSMVVWGGMQLVPCSWCNGGYRFDWVNTGSRYDPVLDRWVGMSTAGAPPAMGSPLTTWTGHDMIVLRNDAQGNGGWRYDPSTDHWAAIAPDGISSVHMGASLVWTGRHAIAWGGWVAEDFNAVAQNTGRRYDPWTDTWTPTSGSNAPSQRSGHSAVWTGSEMIVWGGEPENSQTGPLEGGDRYDPATDSWTRATREAAPLTGKGHVALWTGTEMLVWGGGWSQSGGRYDPRTDSWRRISQVDEPTPRAGFAAAWTGQKMVIWGGGSDPSHPLDTGGIYDPATDHWTATSSVGAPSARREHTAVWTGSRIVFWGGHPGNPSDNLNTGGQFDVETNSWTSTSGTGAPSKRYAHTAVWAGERMVVWGGVSVSTQYESLDTGGRYDPVQDTWSDTSTIGAPPRRNQHAAVAAGDLMLIWGGALSDFVQVGGTYDVVNDRWTKFANSSEWMPTLGTAVWTGDAMIVWSGVSGGRYYLGDSRDDDCDGDGISASAGDCDDNNPATYPAVLESCDGIGNDCLRSWWPYAFSDTTFDREEDYDRDGWRTCAGDCWDNNLYVHPGAAEVCDGWDTDCDGQDPIPTEGDEDHDRVRVCEGDCDDTRMRVHPGGYEECNGYDDDCDGSIDEGGGSLCVFGDVCWTATCLGSEGCTDYAPIEGPCDDGEQCTADDRCIEGGCRGTLLIDVACDDRNGCTIDDRCREGYCDGTPAIDAPCDDGRACTTDDHCGSYGDCNGGPLQPCDDGNDCNGQEHCDYDTDRCETRDVLAGCDDGNICTFDSCDQATGCHHVYNVDPCDDGNACTAEDVCGEGLCLQGVPINCDDGNPCTDDACIPSTGCVHTNNVASCDDGNACTGWQACEGGACVGHDPVICSAGDQCQDAGACDPATGLCTFAAKPDGTVCDDASLCTSGETCQSGSCTPGHNGLDQPNPKSAGYYRKLCEKRAQNQLPYQGDQLTDSDAACVGELTSTFAGIATIDDLCDVIYSDQQDGSHHDSDNGHEAKECTKGEDELIATALNICRARVCEEQRLDSRCQGNAHTTVAQSFADADAILSDAARDKDTCKGARCELREINNGHALEMNSLLLAMENRAVRLIWSSAVLDDGSGAPSGYEVWRRPLGSNDPFVRLGTTAGLTFVDTTAGTAAWEYEITAIIPGQ